MSVRESDVQLDHDARLSAMEFDPLHSDFLSAQTKAFHDAISSQIYASDPYWDEYVVTSAVHYRSLIGGITVENSEVGHQLTVIRTYLLDVFSDYGKYERFLSYRGDAAQDLLDLLQKLLDGPLEPRFRAILYVALLRLCRTSELYPSIFSLTEVDLNFNRPYTGGGFGDVYKGNYKGQAVCVKAIRFHSSSRVSAMETFSREAIVWGQLSHPNILPFLGIYQFAEGHRFCLVSPWMLNENASNFLKTKPAQHDRTSLIFDVVSGMQYLHGNGIVHADLKCANILVGEDERACLADFGLSYIKGYTNEALSSVAALGTPRFLAPELLDPDIEDARRTEASDIFAFGMVCYEMFSMRLPFERATPVAVIHKILSGKRPERPNEQIHLKRGLTDDMWALVESCWAGEPQQRLTATQILAHLQHHDIGINNDLRSDRSTRIRRSGFEIVSTSGQEDTTITAALPHLKFLFA